MLDVGCAMSDVIDLVPLSCRFLRQGSAVNPTYHTPPHSHCFAEEPQDSGTGRSGHASFKHTRFLANPTALAEGLGPDTADAWDGRLASHREQ